MQNDVHMCVQICIIYMCARAEGDGTLRDGRLRVADGLIHTFTSHIREKRANRFWQMFRVKGRHRNPVGVCTHSAGTLEGCH